MAQKSAGRVKRKEKKNIPNGIVYINATFNNTLVTITDEQGNAISWSTSGALGFSGSRKSTPFAAEVAAKEAVKKAVDYCGLKNVRAVVKGPGSGRETALRALHTEGLNVTSLCDVTPLPHNGCRPAKRRRV